MKLEPACVVDVTFDEGTLTYRNSSFTINCLLLTLLGDGTKKKVKKKFVPFQYCPFFYINCTKDSVYTILEWFSVACQ